MNGEDCFCSDYVIGVSSRLSLEILMLRGRSIRNHRYRTPNGYLFDMMRSISACSLKYIDVDVWQQIHLNDVGWLCEALRSFPVLESVRFFVKDGVHLDLLDGLLRNCRGLRHITISSAEIFETDPDVVGARVGESILCHPNIEQIVGGFSMSMIYCMRNIGRAKKQMIAFGGRRIKRVSTRSSVRRLFCDVDRLVWSFLM